MVWDDKKGGKICIFREKRPRVQKRFEDEFQSCSFFREKCLDFTSFTGVVKMLAVPTHLTPAFAHVFFRDKEAIFGRLFGLFLRPSMCNSFSLITLPNFQYLGFGFTDSGIIRKSPEKIGNKISRKIQELLMICRMRCDQPTLFSCTNYR